MKMRAAHRWAMVALLFLFSSSIWAYQTCNGVTSYGGTINTTPYYVCSELGYRMSLYPYSGANTTPSSGVCSNTGWSSSPNADCVNHTNPNYAYQCVDGDSSACYVTTDADGYRSACIAGQIRDASFNCVADPNYDSDGLVNATDYTGTSEDIARLDMCDSGSFVDRRNASLCGDDLYCRTATNTVKKFDVNECVDIGLGEAPYEYDPNKLYTHLNNFKYLAHAADGYIGKGCHSQEFENLVKTCAHNQTLECLDANNDLFLGVCQQEYQPVTNPATGESSAQLMSDVGTPLTYDGSLDMNGSPDGASTWQLNLTMPEPVNNTGFQIGSGGSGGSGGSTGSGGSGGYDNTGSGGSYGGGYTETGTGATDETINDGSGDSVDDGSGVTGSLNPLVGKAGAGFGSEADQALLTAKDELSTTYSNIKGEFDSIFSGSVSNGSAQLPIWNIGTVKGNEVVVDWTKWNSGLVSVGNAVLVLAALIAFGVLFL